MNLPARLQLTLLGLILAGTLGCQGTNLFKRETDQYDPSQYGVTTFEKSEDLKQLSEELPSMSSADQQRISDRLYRDLGQEDSAILRLTMVRALAQVKTPASNAALLAAAKDEDREVKIAACDALGERPGSDAVQVLSEVVGTDSDIDVRLAATRALGKMQNPQAVQGLAIALDDSDPALQRRAVEGLKGVTGQNLGNDVVAWQQYVQGQPVAPRDREEAVAERSLIDRLMPWQ